MAITFVALKTPQQLDAVVKQCCPGHDMWNGIVEAEQEMEQFRQNTGDPETETIAYEVMDGTEGLGLIHFRHTKGGFLKKERVVIHLLTLVKYDPETVWAIHKALVQRYGLSGELVHTLTCGEEGSPIHHDLKAAGFTEKRNSYQTPKYGFEAGALYFVKAV